jgi:hypothetical protein
MPPLTEYELVELPLALASTLISQVSILRKARDLLPPRLVSGEIDVTDLDIAMPEAA